MEGGILDGSVASVTAALERKREALVGLIVSRRADRSFREGLHKGVQNYCAAAAIHGLQVSELKRDLARGTRQHMRMVNQFLSRAESDDAFELRDMVHFVLGLLRPYVELVEQQAEREAATALTCLEPQDLAQV